MESKKSIQLSQAFGAVLTLVLVAVLVIIAIVIFVQLATSFAGTDSVTVTNESGGYINTTGYTLNAAGNCSFGDLSILSAINTTSSAAIPVANITATSAGVITNATAYTLEAASFTYSYTWGSSACDASENMTSEFGNYTSLIGLVGTIIFLGLVIGILVTAFAFGGRRET